MSTTRFPVNLRWSSYVAPKPPKKCSKTQNGRFRCEIALCLKKVCYKFLCVKTVSDKVVRRSWPNYPCKNDWLAATPATWNFASNWPRCSEIADFRSIFARSASAVTPSEKSSINTNRKSTTRFPMSPRWTSYVVPKLPKGGSKTQSVLSLNNKVR